MGKKHEREAINNEREEEEDARRKCLLIIMWHQLALRMMCRVEGAGGGMA